MAKKKENTRLKVCGDCIHCCACRMHGGFNNMDTDATNCVIHTTVQESSAYFLGKWDGKNVPFKPDEDFGAVLTCAIRYALGRRTYMPSLVISFISPLLPALTDNTLRCIDKDITSQQYAGGYGDTCDERDWLSFQSKVWDELKRRGIDIYVDFRESKEGE